MVYDRKLLEIACINNGMRLRGLAKVCGICETSLYEKLNNPNKRFTIPEVEKIVERLNLSGSEVMQIFIKVKKY